MQILRLPYIISAGVHALLFLVLASANDVLRVEYAVRSGQAMPISQSTRARAQPVLLDTRLQDEVPREITFPAPEFSRLPQQPAPPPISSEMDSRFVPPPLVEEHIRRRSERSIELAELPQALRQARQNQENTPEVKGRPIDPLWTPVPAPETPPSLLPRTDSTPQTRPVTQTEVIEPGDAERTINGSDAPQGAKVDVLPKPLPNNREPVYPEILRRRQIGGRVILKVTITPEGLVERVQVDTSSGEPLLDESAISAIRTWRFEPARQGARAVQFEVRLPINFTIRS